jgi:hypothetical protein
MVTEGRITTIAITMMVTPISANKSTFGPGTVAALPRGDFFSENLRAHHFKSSFISNPASFQTQRRRMFRLIEADLSAARK